MKCLFVGSFNPVTLAHINISKYLLNNYIDYLYIIPVNSNKDNLVSIADRIKMLELVKGNNMEILDIYKYNPDGLFNYYVLEEIKKEKQTLGVIIGADLLLKLKTFIQYEKILTNYKIIVIERMDIDIEKVIDTYYSKYKESFMIIDANFKGSSSDARGGLKNKKNNYLAKEVLDYIKENNLYN